MKLRLATLAFLALAFLSVDAAAQSRTSRSRAAKPEIQYGSVLRTRLLKQCRGTQTSGDVLQLGSVARRAVLTGKRYQLLPKQQRMKRF